MSSPVAAGINTSVKENLTQHTSFEQSMEWFNRSLILPVPLMATIMSFIDPNSMLEIIFSVVTLHNSADKVGPRPILGLVELWQSRRLKKTLLRHWTSTVREHRHHRQVAFDSGDMSDEIVDGEVSCWNCLVSY
jgi:hypothetical protein